MVSISLPTSCTPLCPYVERTGDRERGEAGALYHQHWPEPLLCNRAMKELIRIEESASIGCQWLFLLHTYVNRRLFKSEPLYLNNRLKSKVLRQKVSLAHSHPPTPHLSHWCAESFSDIPRPHGTFFLQRRKHWVYLCTQGNGQPSFTPRKMHTDTMEEAYPRPILPSASLANPSPAAPPAQSCCCISLLTYKAPSSPVLSLPQAETIHHAVGLWHTQMGEGSQISLTQARG